MFLNDIEYRVAQPPLRLAEFIESCWLLVNHSAVGQPVVIVPDGRVDTFFSYSADEPYHVTLLGLQTRPAAQVIPPRSRLFAISWKLLAVEYLLPVRLADLGQGGGYLPANYLVINAEDLLDFEGCCAKAAAAIAPLLPGELDSRKQKLFALLHDSEGSLPVEALAQAAAWSSRQINRYFRQMFGLTLKAYCNILRFRASFQHLREGQLFPEQNFFDQAHFIREIKRYAGVVPKELARNQDDRFIQLAALPKK